MPITITLEQFKADTRNTFFERPNSLKWFDGDLRNYHRAMGLGNKTAALYFLKEMDRQLTIWAKNKRVVQRGNIRCYAHLRDKVGTLYKMRVQIDQNLPRLAQLLAIETTARAKNRHAPTVNNRRNFAMEHERHQFAHAAENYNLERELGPELDGASVVGSRASTASFLSEENRNSFRDGYEQPAHNRTAGHLGPQAFEAISYFLAAGLGSFESAMDLAHELREAGNGLTVTSTRATLGGLFQAMQACGYRDLHLREHCTHDSVINTLTGATPRRPVMVVVGGNAPPFRLVNVIGHTYTKHLTTTDQIFTTIDGSGIGGANGAMYGALARDGQYIHNRNFIVENLIPTAGIIKYIA